jgi:SH3-like domain-containing protein
MIAWLRAAVAAVFTFIAAIGPTHAGSGNAAASAPTLPRFVSIKADRVNVRGGPAKDHAIAFIFTRVGWPVEITAQFEDWRRIRDWDGSQGWVYHALLSDKRTAAVWLKGKTGLTPVHAAPTSASPVLAQLEVGVIGTVKACTGTWCHLVGKKFDGWVAQNSLWGVLPNEKIE